MPRCNDLSRGAFHVGACNADAVALLETQDWPNAKLALVGPKGSGKTHLVTAWARANNAVICAANALPQAAPHGPLVVEDCHTIAGHRVHEERLFHIHNTLHFRGERLVMTARRKPARWAYALPDMQSRAEGTMVAEIKAPDDAMLQAVLIKLMADRQLSPASTVVPFMVRHMERSFEAAWVLVEQLDALSLEHRRDINRGLAAELLKVTDD